MDDQPLGAVAMLVMGQSPPGPTCNQSGLGDPLLNGPTEFGSRYPTARQWTTDSRRLCRSGAVLLCVRGSTTGRTNRADQPYAIGRGVAAVEIQDPCDQVYVYYALLFRLDRLLEKTTGSVFPNLSKDDIRSLLVPWPEPTVRRSIAEVLAALDDKIEMNATISNKLYELAILIGIAACESGAGRYVTLTEVADIAKGVSYRSEDLTPGAGWLVGLKCASRDGSFRYDGMKPYSGPSKPAQVLAAGDVLVAHTDLTQRAEVIGRPIRVPHLDVGGTLTASLDFAVVRPREKLSREVLLAILSTQEFRHHALSYCNGTTVLHLNANAVASYEFSLPDREVVAKATKVMAPMLERSDAARKEGESLAALRETLLSKLMSGELRVRGSDGLVGEAV